MARTSRELARRPAVDPRDEPSVEWGWHGRFPNGLVIAGLMSIAFLLGMFFFGHEKSGTEELFLLGFVALIVAGLVRRAMLRRHAWRR